MTLQELSSQGKISLPRVRRRNRKKRLKELVKLLQFSQVIGGVFIAAIRRSLAQQPGVVHDGDLFLLAGQIVGDLVSGLVGERRPERQFVGGAPATGSGFRLSAVTLGGGASGIVRDSIASLNFR